MKKLVLIFLVLALLFSACGYSKEDLEEAYWKGYYDAEDEHKYDYDDGDFDGYYRGYDEGYADGYNIGWEDCSDGKWNPPKNN